MWRLNKRLGLVVLLGVLLRTAVSAVYSTLSRRNAKAQTDALARCADVAEQGLSLVSTVRAHGTEDFEGARYAARLDPLLDLQTQQGALYGGVRVVNGALNTMLVSVVLALGGGEPSQLLPTNCHHTLTIVHSPSHPTIVLLQLSRPPASSPAPTSPPSSCTLSSSRAPPPT